MGRPVESGLNYFYHDCDASSDEKIEALEMLYGHAGYAFYFKLLERIYRTPNAELDISDAETRQILVRKLSVTEEAFDRMFETAFKHGAFDRQAFDESGVLTSHGIKTRAGKAQRKREAMRERYWQRFSGAETRPEIPQGKVGEGRSNGKGSRGNKSASSTSAGSGKRYNENGRYQKMARK
jgi:hypothetical protein